MRLSLRARLIAGLVAVATVLVGLGWLVLTTTQGHLVGQLDERLEAIADPVRDARLSESGPRRPDAVPPGAFGGERLGNLYEGIVFADGGVEVVFAPNLGTDELSLPDLSWPSLVDRTDETFTVDAIEGDLRYRAVATSVTPDSLLVRALPLDDVDETVERLTLLVVLGVGAVVAVLAAVAWFSPTSRDEDVTPLDPVGAVLSLVGLAALLFGIIEGPEQGWTSGLVIGGFVVGALGLTGFALWERRTEHPMLPLDFFGDRRF
ncbi:MAG: hypothetical protein AAGF02_13105, partial [Actinomycetota bacterium]